MRSAMAGRVLPAIAVPLLVIGGYLVAPSAGGFLGDFWDDFLGPFLITYWVGLGFANAWFVLRRDMHAGRLSPGIQAATAAAVIVVFLIMLGGPQALLDDPWLFGVVVAPGMELILPWLLHKAGTADGRAQPSGDA